MQVLGAAIGEILRDEDKSPDNKCSYLVRPARAPVLEPVLRQPPVPWHDSTPIRLQLRELPFRALGSLGLVPVP